MGVKLANVSGAHVVLFTIYPTKTADGLRLGAHEVVVSRDETAMKKHLNSFDSILDTVSADHDVPAYLQRLKRDGRKAWTPGGVGGGSPRRVAVSIPGPAAKGGAARPFPASRRDASPRGAFYCRTQH